MNNRFESLILSAFYPLSSSSLLLDRHPFPGCRGTHAEILLLVLLLEIGAGRALADARAALQIAAAFFDGAAALEAG